MPFKYWTSPPAFTIEIPISPAHNHATLNQHLHSIPFTLSLSKPIFPMLYSCDPWPICKAHWIDLLLLSAIYLLVSHQKSFPTLIHSVIFRYQLLHRLLHQCPHRLHTYLVVKADGTCRWTKRPGNARCDDVGLEGMIVSAVAAVVPMIERLCIYESQSL